MEKERVYVVLSPDGPKTFFSPGNAANYLAKLLEKAGTGEQFRVTVKYDGNTGN